MRDSGRKHGSVQTDKQTEGERERQVSREREAREGRNEVSEFYIS